MSRATDVEAQQAAAAATSGEKKTKGTIHAFNPDGTFDFFLVWSTTCYLFVGSVLFCSVLDTSIIFFLSLFVVYTFAVFRSLLTSLICFFVFWSVLSSPQICFLYFPSSQHRNPIQLTKSSSSTTKDFDPNDADGVNQTTWGEVCSSCFCHTPIEWANIVFHLVLVVFFLYFFILGLEILGDGAQVMTGCVAGELFGDDQNPLSGVMIGILITVCMQSSSTTTSIVVSLVGSGVVSVEAGIYVRLHTITLRSVLCWVWFLVWVSTPTHPIALMPPVLPDRSF